MLEIGAGAGYFLDEARKAGFDVYGIEINKILAEFISGRLGIPCEEFSPNGSSFDRKKFDIVYHCDVISHFYDPISEFEKINNMLKKGGFMVFETGNGGDVEEKYYKYSLSFQYPDHLFFFSVDNLKELLLRTGFELISIYRFSILAELILLIIIKRCIPAKPNTAEKLEDSNGTSHSYIEAKEPFLKKIIKNLLFCFDFLVRYKLGYLLPKKRQPQTIILVARKNDF